MAAGANGIHFLGDGETVTARLRYAELEDAVRAAAAWLQHGCGVAAGQHVPLLLPDAVVFTVTFLACQRIGAVPVSLSPNLNRHSNPERLAAVVAGTRAPLLLVDASRAGHAAFARLRERAAVRVQGVGAAFPGGFPAAAERQWPTAFVQYTSGSSGTPKGAVVSRRALLAQFDLLVRCFGFSARSVFVSWLPLHHDMGLVSKVLLPHHLGATVAHMPPAAFAQRPARWLRAIDRFRGSVSSAPDAAYAACLDIPDGELAGLDLSNWEAAVCGAEVVRARTLRRFAERFAAAGFRASALRPAYGMAEAVLMACAHPPHGGDLASAAPPAQAALPSGALAACGEPPPGSAARVVSPQGVPCPDGEVGEIWLRGPSLADGYLLADGSIDRAPFSRVLAGAHAQGGGDGAGGWFATGDLGWRGAGGLYVLGRAETTLTLAGQKLPFEEIEALAREADPRLPPNAVAAIPAGEGRGVALVQELARERIDAQEYPRLALAMAEAVQRTVALPVAGVLFSRRPLPRTSSGKLQRVQLRRLVDAGDWPGTWIDCRARAPATPAAAGLGAREGEVLALVAGMLGADPEAIDPDATLARLGVESLGIARLQFALAQRFGAAPGLEALYGLRVREIAALCVQGAGAAAAPDAAGPPDGGAGYAATPQQADVYAAEAAAGRPIYTLARAVRVAGPLESGALQRALAALERRYPVLRSRLHAGEDGLRVQPDAPSAGNLVVEQAGEHADALLRQWVLRGIDAHAQRLYRVVQLRLPDASCIVLLQVHHAIADFWALSLLWRGLAPALAGGPGAPPQEMEAGDDEGEPYAAYAARLARDNAAAQAAAAHWRGTLDARCDPRLPLSNPGGTGWTVQVRAFALEAAVQARLRAAARACGVTPQCALQLAFAAALASLTRRTRVRWGLALLNRAAAHRHTFGMFADLVPMELALAPDAPAGGQLAALGAALAAGQRDAGGTLAALRGEAALATGSLPGTLFDAVFAGFDVDGDAGDAQLGDLLLDHLDAPARAGGAPLASVPLHDGLHGHYPLQLYAVSARGGLRVRVEYRSDLLNAVLADSFVAQFQAAAAALAAQPQAPLSAMLALAPPLAAQVAAWARGPVEPAHGASVLGRILGVAAAHPGRVALHDAAGGEAWTYGRLLSTAGEVAARIRARQTATAGAVVALLEPRSPAAVAACLGILLAGAVYLPVDPALPPARRDHMLRDSGAVLAIGSVAPADLPAGLPVLPLAPCVAAGQAPAAALPPLSARFPCLPAYLIYTSGSTGQPKGALLDHAALDNRIGWMAQRLAFAPSDVFLLKTAWSFDVSLWEILAPLAAGARAVCLPAGQERLPEAVSAAMRAHGVTVVHFVPTVLAQWLRTRGAGDAARGLRACVCSGERLLPTHAEAFFAGGTAARLYNFYGPTEAGIDVTWTEVLPGAAAVTIGGPAPNCDAVVVDDAGLPVPPGVPGELVVAGPQVALGYVGRPALSAACFGPSPLGAAGRAYRTGDVARLDGPGRIAYLGRRDGQVKLAGQRIELAEIESAIGAFPGVLDAVAVLDADAQRLHAFVRAPAQAQATPAALAAHLAARLPAAMLPHAWHGVDAYPLLSSGKADRAALLALAQRRQVAASDGAGGADVLAQLWCRVLDRTDCRDGDDFFACGGDSIRALQYVGLLAGAGIDLTVAELFTERTPGALRRLLAGRGRAAPRRGPPAPFALLRDTDQPLARAPGVEDAYPLCGFQQAILYKALNDPHYTVFVTSLEIAARWDAAAMRRAIAAVLAAHPFLRASIDMAGCSEPLQLVHREVEPPLAVHDLSGHPEAARRGLLAAWLAGEHRRPFAWEQPPLLRFTAHLLGPDSFQLTFSEVSLDGWCVATVLSELLAGYRALLAGSEAPAAAPVAARYAEFVALEQQAVAAPAQRRFWRERLARAAPPGRLAGMMQPSGSAHRRTQLRQAPARTVRLAAAAAGVGVPLKSLLLAAHLAALARLDGQAVQTTGVEFNGRPEVPGGDRLVGVFNNMLPLTLDLAGLGWRELARACLREERDILPWRRFPYAELLRLNGGRAPFEALFVYTHFHAYRAAEGAGLRITGHFANDQTYMPLTVHFNRDHRDDALEVLLDFDERQVAAPTVERFARALQQQLDALCTADLARDGPLLPHPAGAPG